MTRRFMSFRSLAALCMLLAGCAATSWLGHGEEAGWRAEPLPAWEGAFRNADPRWRGGDGAYSVPLSSSRTLWLFGDTLVTEPHAAGREGARVIRNSIAIQRIDQVDPGPIEFLWKEGEAAPEAPFPPPTGTGWLWPLSGERVGACLLVFLGEFVRNDTKLGFEPSGSWLFRIPDPDAPYDAWDVDRFRIPFFEHSPDGDLLFGVEAMFHEGFLYVYGVREDWSRGVEGRSLLVARVHADAVDRMDFSEWRFFAGDAWVEDPRRSRELFDGAATEMSVAFVRGQDRFLAVYTHCGLSERILARASPSPEGPWGEPTVLYRCPEVAWSEDYFCYAGKAHPEFEQGDGEWIITYAVNSWNLEDLERDLRIYWPRFIRVERRLGPTRGIDPFWGSNESIE